MAEPPKDETHGLLISEPSPSQLLNSIQQPTEAYRPSAHDVSSTIDKLKHKYMYPYAFDFRG